MFPTVELIPRIGLIPTEIPLFFDVTQLFRGYYSRDAWMFSKSICLCFLYKARENLSDGEAFLDILRQRSKGAYAMAMF